MLYSIIIPHFRSPRMLRRALNSVPVRDDVEIIVVDDNSGDEYFDELSDAVSLRGDQVNLVLLNKNGGGGKARNEGLKLARGKWVVFLDSDDYFNYCVDDAFDDYKDSDADIVFFKALGLDGDKYTVTHRADRVNECVECWLKNSREGEYMLRYEQGVPWGKFIKRSLLTDYDIWFEEIRKHNDVRFSYTSGFYAGKILADDRAIYCITTRSDSVSTDVSAEARLIRVKVLLDMIEFKQAHGVEVREYELLFNTLAEIKEKDVEVFNEAKSLSLSSAIDNRLINKGINRSLFKASMRKITPLWIRNLRH